MSIELRVVERPPETPALADGARVGGWWRELPDDPSGPSGRGQSEPGRAGRILCELCPRACHLRPGDRGFCFVRENRDGQMVLSTYGRSTGFCVDPIEKKPLNHFYPGTSILSFGTAGCNLGCKFCQNWDISKSREVARLSERATPEMVAQAAVDLGCHSVAFTYNDPVVWAEYAIDTALACRERGVRTVAVTAGYISPAARRPFFETMDAANVDLKAFTEEFYFSLTSSHLQPVLDTLVWLVHESEVWVELTTLLIPGANDSRDELRRLCQWVVRELGPDVPLHFTAFHPDFRLTDRPPTPHAKLIEARQLALDEGVRHAYVGNVLDEARQSTYCPGCGTRLIQRDHYALGEYRLRNGRCDACGTAIAGRFADRPGDWGRRRLPVRIGDHSPPPSMENRSDPMTSKTTQGGAANIGVSSTGTSSTGTSNTGTSSTGTSNMGTLSRGLGEPQRAALLEAAWETIDGAARGLDQGPTDPTLGGVAALRVDGLFVTLKRRGALRGCCGVLGQPMPLGDALLHAARRTAIDDLRLPPVVPEELPYLTLDISLLHDFQPVRLAGRERIGAIEVGRHGLRIRRGERSGLLLPVVALEHNLDGEQFLEAVCRKAGLGSADWERDDTELLTFEAEVVEGDELGAAGAGDSPPPLLDASELEQLRRHCQANVIAHHAGATPTYYLPGCPDGTVQAVSLSAAIPGLERPLFASQISLRPGVPLQATLLNLTQAVAGVLRQHGVDPHEVRCEVTIVDGITPHGTVAEPDLRGVDPARRAQLVVERGKTAWVFDPRRDSEGLAVEAAALAGVHSPQQALVYSGRALSTAPRIAISSLPAAQPGRAERVPAVAGTFYPDDPEQLERLVDTLIGELPAERRPYPAAIVPHAGLRFSGQIAADVLKRIEIPPTVIVIGPKHTALGVDWAVAPEASWRIPGGVVEGDPALARLLVERVPGLQLDAAAHAREHAIEVELPFLRRLAPRSRVVGLALAGSDWPRAQALAKGLADVLRSLPEPPLLLVSSDMNHFADDAETRRLDELALAAVDAGDGERLLATCERHQISMCGVFPAAIVIETLRQLGGAPRGRRVAYGTSADTTGDRSRVVGYAGVLLEG